jgi:hypothetical protein
MSVREASVKAEAMPDQQKSENMEERLLGFSKVDTSVRHPSPAMNRGADSRSTAHSASSSLKESVSGRLLSGVVGVAEVLLRGSRNPSGNNTSGDSVKNASLEDFEEHVQPRCEDTPSELNSKEKRKVGAVHSVCGPDITGTQSQQACGANSGSSVHPADPAARGIRTDSAIDSAMSKESQIGRSITPNPVTDRIGKYPSNGSAWNMKSHSESSVLDTTPKRGDGECKFRDDHCEMNSPKMEADRKIYGPHLSHTHTPQNPTNQSTAHKSQLLGGMVGSAVTISSGVVEGIRNSVPSLPSTSMFTWTGGRNSAEDLQRLGEENIALASEVNRY